MPKTRADYSNSREKIRRFLEELVPALAHEYGHHILTTVGGLGQPYHQFITAHERFAEGIARLVGKPLANQKENRNIPYIPLSRAKLYLLRVPENLRNIKKERTLFGETITLQFPHELGTALFAVLEAERGPDIYRQILHGEFKW